MTPRWRRRYQLALAGVLALHLVAIWAVRDPPLLDYPNHLARIHVMSRLHDVPAFAQRYRLVLQPVPNLAVDLVVAPLAALLPLEVAGKIFLSLIAALFVLGCHRLGRALHDGRETLTAPACAFFLFNMMFFYGFVNCLFAIALALPTLAIWLAGRRAPSWRRTLCVTLLVTAVYLAHVTGFVVLGAAFATVLALERRHVVHGLAPLVPAVLLNRLVTSPAAIDVAWDTPFGKLKGATWLFASYDLRVDAVVGLAFAIALALLWRRRAGVQRAGLLIAAVYAALWLVFPVAIADGWAADRRFLLPMAIVALLAVRVEAAAAGFALALVAIAARVAFVVASWVPLDGRITQERRLLAAVPEGARVYAVAFDPPNRRPTLGEIARRCSVCWVTIDRDAPMSLLFDKPGQQPLRRLAPDPRYQPAAPHVAPEQAGWDVIFTHYDLVFAQRLTPAYRAFLDARCQRVAESGDDVLYRGCRLSRKRAGP